jgi:hypothetical protein
VFANSTPQVPVGMTERCRDFRGLACAAANGRALMTRVQYFPPPVDDPWRQCAPQLVKRMREIADTCVRYGMQRINVQISGRR